MASSSKTMATTDWEPELLPKHKIREPELLPKHKIFLSHSGAQKPFVEQLCVDLERHNYYPFFDKRSDSLPKGKEFPNLIFQAAERCLVAVVVLSHEFFTKTKWPMLELAAFVKARKSREELYILPVCLNLSFASVKDKLELWLQQWEQWAKEDKRLDTDEWQAALKALSPINALESNKYDGDVSLRRAIVRAIEELIPPEIMSDVSHVQGKERICEEILREFARVPPMNDYQYLLDTKVLGVYGIVGTGKTTLCMSLCNRLRGEFEGKVCHVELGTRNIVKLLRKVLRQLTEADKDFLHRRITTKEEGQDCLKQRMHRQRVFLALDNVSDSPNSIKDALIFLHDVQFHPKSMVLVTARSKEVLWGSLGIHLSCCVVAPSIQEDEAEKIVLHQVNFASDLAKSHLTTKEKEVLNRIVEVCHFSHGSSYHFHPLALKMLGAQWGSAQRGSNPLQWTPGRLDFRHSTDSDHPLFSVVETSYSRLPDQKLKDMFLDVALYSPEEFRTVEKICQWLSDTLYDDDIKKCLTILRTKTLVEDWRGDKEILRIHDLHRELAHREAEPGRSNGATRFFFQRGAEEAPRASKRVAKQIERMGFTEGKFECLSFEMYQSLRLLSLRSCEKLQGELDLHGLQSLVSLELSECPLIQCVNMRGLKSLSWVYISHCQNLVKLDLMGDSKSIIRCLTLSNCGSLSELDLSGCKRLRSVTLTYSDSLLELNLSGSEGLKCLTLRFCRALLNVNLGGVTRLSTFIKWCCHRLLQVDGGGEGFGSRLGSDVVCLRIDRWQNVPEGVMQIVERSRCLEALEVWESPMSRLPDLRSCLHIRELTLSNVDVLLPQNCAMVRDYYTELLSLPSPPELPSSLERIHISDCRNVTIWDMCHKLQGLRNLKVLVLRRVRLVWDWELQIPSNILLEEQMRKEELLEERLAVYELQGKEKGKEKEKEKEELLQAMARRTVLVQRNKERWEELLQVMARRPVLVQRNKERWEEMPRELVEQNEELLWELVEQNEELLLQLEPAAELQLDAILLRQLELCEEELELCEEELELELCEEELRWLARRPVASLKEKEVRLKELLKERLKGQPAALRLRWVEVNKRSYTLPTQNCSQLLDLKLIDCPGFRTS